MTFPEVPTPVWHVIFFYGSKLKAAISVSLRAPSPFPHPNSTSPAGKSPPAAPRRALLGRCCGHAAGLSSHRLQVQSKPGRSFVLALFLQLLSKPVQGKTSSRTLASWHLTLARSWDLCCAPTRYKTVSYPDCNLKKVIIFQGGLN